MTPEQALEILSQVAAKYQGTLQDHQALQASLEVIKGLLPKPAPVAPSEPAAAPAPAPVAEVAE
jgi:hypothetical protein